MPRKMCVWANCSLKMSDLELESWLLRGVLSVGNSLGVIGGEASALPFCVPVSQLGMGHGFIHLNTPAASKSWAGDRESDLKVPNPSCVPVSDVVRNEEASSFLAASTPRWFITCLSSFLLFSAREEFLLSYSLILTLDLQKHRVPSSSPRLCELPCSGRRYLDFYFCIICCCTRNQRLR